MLNNKISILNFSLHLFANVFKTNFFNQMSTQTKLKQASPRTHKVPISVKQIIIVDIETTMLT